MKWQAVTTIVRDAGFLVVGFGGIIYQQWTQQVNPWLLAVYTTMLGIPSAIGLLQLSRGRSATPTIPESSSTSVSSPSLSRPSSES